MVKVIKGNEFVENVENTKGVVVVDVSATWCGPCKMLAPVFEGVSLTYVQLFCINSN